MFNQSVNVEVQLDGYGGVLVYINGQDLYFDSFDQLQLVVNQLQRAILTKEI